MQVSRFTIKRRFGMLDLIIFIGILALLYLLMSPGIGRNIARGNVQVSTDISDLPVYALYSTARMMAAYILSLVFTLIYGYIAAHNERAEKILIPILDILQSIPVLSFLPAVVLGLISLFPHNSIGLEISSVILIFTGQAWNMTFSFYNSTKIVPKDLKEASGMLQLNKWQVFKRLELPYSAIGLVWNSMMSWAGGWFFLMACETFTLRGRDFRLLGLGSYLQQASNEGNNRALLFGIIILLLIIILLDQLVWRPIIAWSDKFKVELTESGEAPRSFILTMIRRSVIIELLTEKVFSPFGEWLNICIDKVVGSVSEDREKKESFILRIIKWIIGIFLLVIILYAVLQAVILVSKAKLSELSLLIPAVLYSFLRVAAAQIIALIWTVPVGVGIGMNKKLANFLQPIIQIIASVPATAIFPIVLGIFIQKAGGLNVASVFLMLMGTQWYILFNVIAGAMAIPEDLKAASKTFGLKGYKKWRILILPSIFPYLVTGMITATGGCWNASIVSEYVSYGGNTFSTIGLGSLISNSTEKGNFPMLLLSTIVMCIVVVGVNKTLWKRMYHMAENKYKVEL